MTDIVFFLTILFSFRGRKKKKTIGKKSHELDIFQDSNLSITTY